MSETYNGWTNYETWLVNLWMGNDSPQERYWADATREAHAQAAADATFTKAERARFDLAAQIQDAHEDAAEEMLKASSYEQGPFADLLRGAMSEVNWGEIAKHWIEAYCEVEV